MEQTIRGSIIREQNVAQEVKFIHYLLHLADDSLILGHRNSEWCGHGPALEQDIAITNIALDLIGQARNFYQYAAEIMNASKEDESDKNAETEDTLAYLRDAIDFKNCLLVEQPKGDWAITTLRQFLFSCYQYFLYEHLQKSIDAQIAAIAEKSLKEVTYHFKWSSEWVIRLGDGTKESRARMVNALDELWRFTGELFTPVSYETEIAKQDIGVDANLIKDKWMQKVTSVLEEATLKIPADVWIQTGGKEGRHTEHLGYILAEMQFLQRAYPNAEW